MTLKHGKWGLNYEPLMRGRALFAPSRHQARSINQPAAAVYVNSPGRCGYTYVFDYLH